jgi:hypothetical protein
VRRWRRPLRIGALAAVACWLGGSWLAPGGGERRAPPPGARARSATRSVPECGGTPTSRKPARRAADPAQPTPATAHPLPEWLARVLEDGAESDAGGPDAAGFATNEALAGGSPPFDPRQLAALADIVDANGLGEDSSPFDFDDGDGTLEPWELGFQVWRGADLVALLLGPDPFWSFGYRIDELPATIAGFHRLRLLDLHGNRLERLPDELGDLGELRELRLQRNRLVELPDRIGDLRQLDTLVVGGNALALLPASLAGLPRLERLHANDNPLVMLPERLGDAERLRVIGVDRAATGSMDGPASGLTGLPSSLATLPGLTTVYVAGNRLTCSGSDPRGLRSLAQGRAREVFGISAQRCGPGGT